MSIEELIKKECPEGVEYKALGEICVKITDGSHFSPASVDDGYFMPSVKDMTRNGFDFSDCKKISKEDYIKLVSNGCRPQVGDVLIAKDGSMLSYVFPVEEELDIVVLSSIAIIRPKLSIIDSRFLTHFFSSKSLKEKVVREFSTKGGVPRIILKNFKQIQIPLPPLSVQEKIVEVLDKFTALESELQAELEARKKQYEYYRNELLNFEGKDVEIKTLGDVSDILVGNPFDSSKFVEEGVRLMRGMNIKREYLDFSEDLNRYWESEKGLERYLLEPEDIVMSMDGSLVGKSFAMVSEDHLPLLLVQRVARIRSTEADIHYLYYCICNGFFNYVNKKKTAGAIPHISQKDIANYPIPVPPKEDQLRIVSILDKFEALVNDALPKEIAARHQQYEYYRDKLLSFERKK